MKRPVATATVLAIVGLGCVRPAIKPSDPPEYCVADGSTWIDPPGTVTMDLRDLKVLNPQEAAAGYPDSLKSAAIEGRVAASVLVDARGIVDPRSVRIVEASIMDFVPSVCQALSRVRYGLNSGEPLPPATRVTARFEFRLGR